MPPSDHSSGLFRSNGQAKINTMASTKSGLFGNAKPSAALYQQQQRQLLEALVLPKEKIYVAMETKKFYAFSANGSIQTIKSLLALLKLNQNSVELFKTLLQSMCFADQLLAYHNSELMDKLLEFLMQTVQETETNEEIKQIIWRVFVVGWFKFARDSKSALELVSLIVNQSKNTSK